ncbi:synaptonemal complex central element protein 3 [Pangasianodon hypophthalmus]|uniref:synaptonemal complex central element protein 3 n=1 Tax=Pangasianodon hypophthalmus TaxID=310915 RepID=UPI000EFFEA90|nr:synaptonemal complex central element protein 3 [Pangasianodon hypophthalmus]XP_026774196.3 synaptonemal complex central element protein 3 [Pangasianodon hypophthalmus]XP_026774197.3 synaptonemal complex central element protein 3 [Pangasianodon hypophthalmus]
MVDSASAGEQCEDFGRETLEFSKDLERMTEEMENISVNLTWMAYDMVVLRTDPQLAKALKRLENEFIQCKAVICGSGDNLVNQCTVANQKTTQE